MSDKEPTDLAPRPSNETSEIIRPQYMTGFEGMAVAPFDEKIRQVLAEAPDPAAVEIKPNGIVFLPGVWWRRQLTRAFQAGGWALAPRGPARVMGDLVVWPGALFCLGRFVGESVGENAYFAKNSQMSYASAVEGAKTDCLTRCCKDLGMGTHLWDKAWRDRWMAEYAEKGADGKWHHRSGRPVQDIDLMAGAGGAAPAPKESTAVPSNGTTAKSIAASQKASAASSTPVSPPQAGASSSSGSSAPPTTKSGPPPQAAPTPGTPDTGEAATAEQKLTLRGHVKRLGWKGHFAKMWLKGLFGFDSPDSLTVDQCLNACLLAEVFGTEKYKPLQEDLRKEGLIKAEAA